MVTQIEDGYAVRRTGLTIGTRQDVDDGEIIALAKRADELGYDTVWTGEAWGRDVFTVLTMIACHTRNLRVGTGIATVFSRTPALIAQSIASLDIISRGRAVLGLGTSGRRVVEGWHGVGYQRPLERTAEYIRIIRLVLSGRRVDYDGRLFQLARFRLPFSPVRSSIPIFVASLGPRNLALTGELADGWLPTWVHVDHLPAMKDTVRAGAEAAGRTIDQVSTAPQILCYVASGPDEMDRGRRLLSGHVAYYVGGMGDYYHRLFSRYGYREECDRIRGAWRAGDRAHAASLVSGEMLDKVAVLGGADECRAKLDAYRTAGADVPVVGFPHGCPPDAALRTLEALAPEG